MCTDGEVCYICLTDITLDLVWLIAWIVSSSVFRPKASWGTLFGFIRAIGNSWKRQLLSIGQSSINSVNKMRMLNSVRGISDDNAAMRITVWRWQLRHWYWWPRYQWWGWPYLRRHRIMWRFIIIVSPFNAQNDEEGGLRRHRITWWLIIIVWGMTKR